MMECVSTLKKSIAPPASGSSSTVVMGAEGQCQFFLASLTSSHWPYHSTGYEGDACLTVRLPTGTTIQEVKPMKRRRREGVHYPA
jgi:hypothetical protein